MNLRSFFFSVIAVAAITSTSTLAADTPLLSRADTWHYHKGTNAPQTHWQTLSADSLDATWSTGNGGFGYASSAAETINCQTLLPDMEDGYTTVYIRKMFVVTDTVESTNRLKLTMDWDDGFVAYLDGEEIQRAFAPGSVATEPAFTATATGNHECSTGSGTPQPVVTYDLGPVGSRLAPGEHVLAIVGLNVSSGSSDFILVADLAHGPLECPANTLCEDTIWTLAGSPHVISNSLTIAAGATLTIEPGAMVQFANGTGLTIQGRLVAEGNPTNRIQFTRQPGATSWSRLDFQASQSESRITFADIAYAASSGNIRGNSTALHLESVVWTNISVQLLDLASTSITLLNCVFPNISGDELFHFSTMPANGHALIKGNYFGVTTGGNDIIDFTGGNRPGPIVQLIDNIFTGGTDDCFDMDGTDAHIEGNIFLNVHQDAFRASTTSAITTGAAGGNTSELMIVRNIIYDCDHALLLKDNGSAVLQNNTIVRIHTNNASSAASAVINFFEDRPGVVAGAAALLDGNIIWDVQDNTLALNFTNGLSQLAVLRTIFPTTNFPGSPGIGNSTNDPMFVNWQSGITAQNIRSNLALMAGSPAIGTGPNGLDMGALVPAGATITGEPPATTTNNSAVLTVAGPGIVAYQWRLNGGVWSATVPLTNSFAYSPTLFDDAVPITLTNLAPGAYTVEVIGMNSETLPLVVFISTCF